MKHTPINLGIKALLLVCALSSVKQLNAQTNLFPATGNVGIGTVTPGAPLDILKPNSIGARICNNTSITTADGSIIFDMTNSSSNLWRLVVGGKNNGLGLNSGQFYIERSGLGAMLVINQSGNVLINKAAQTNAEYKLDVGGKIRANEIVVNTSGADFVFADDYKLHALKEVESFVKTNRHLPGIASAAEMKTEGMEVGELTKTLLQKVEELTLYIIEQQKQIDSLQAQLKK